MEKIRVYLIPSKWQNEELLGRKVCEYVERAICWLDCKIVDQAYDMAFEDGIYHVVLPLACPLVKAEDIARIVKSMRIRGEKKVRFDNSSAYIQFGKGGGSEIFVSNSAFFEISDAKSFCLVYNILKDRIADGHLSRGVMIVDKLSTFIDDTVEIEGYAKILPFCRIQGRTKIESGATISASFVEDSIIHAGARVESSHVVGSHIGDNATVGPFARLRGATIGKDCRIGDFVEVKASTIGSGTKSAHLTYIGDATVGERTNIGCGTVFCNYDGKLKHKTTVGDDCFVGANVNLVAPLSVGNNCFVAAGTTVTNDLPDCTFAIGRTYTKTRFNTQKQKD